MATQQQQHRHDGRVSPHQLRDSALSRALHSRADGSALWRQGGTAVLAVAYGPRAPSSIASEDPERCVIEVAWRPRAGGAPGPRERALEAVVARCAQGALLSGQHPRCTVLVALQVLSDDGGALACALNAACAAMVDAGLPMAFMFGAVSCALGRGGGGDGGGSSNNNDGGSAPLLLLDPDADEEAKARAILVAAYPYRAVLPPPSDEMNNDDEDGGGGAAAPAAPAPPAPQLFVSEGALTVDLRGRACDEALALGMGACRRGVEALAAFAREVVAEGVARGAGAAAAAIAAGTAAAADGGRSAKKARGGKQAAE
jgi:exosome complex component RRP46